MSNSKNNIVKLLNAIEPNYLMIVKKLGDDDYPILYELMEGKDIGLACKVICCLGLLKTKKSWNGVAKAAQSENREIRMTAAFALRYLTNFPKTVSIIGHLLNDSSLEVRKYALKSIEFAKITSLKKEVKELGQKEKSDRMKNLSLKILDVLNKIDPNVN